MSMIAKTTLIAAASLALLTPLTTFAQAKPDMSAWSHALGDLRQAKTSLKHAKGDAPASAEEKMAIKEIDKAIGEATRIASGNGQSSDNNMAVGVGATGEGPSPDRVNVLDTASAKPDVHPDHVSRVHDASDLLAKAKSDLTSAPADASTTKQRDQIVAHIDAAIQSLSASH
jgi:hypothetical protein